MSSFIGADVRLRRQGHGEVRELAAGVDALYLSGRAALPSALAQRLESTRSLAEEVCAPLPFGFGGLEFVLAPHSWGHYRYLLLHDLGRIGLSTSTKVPPIRIQPKAELLHAVGPSSAVAGYCSVIEAELGVVQLSVSRLDLFVDVQNWELSAKDRIRFVYRATNCRTFEEGAHFTGFQFGSRVTKTFSARIYDKTADVKRHGTDWWFAIWGDSYVPGRPVHRVEFEIGRKGVTDFGLDGPGEVLVATGDLWRYATEDWLTFCVPTGDSTRSRWPVAPEWFQIQRASLRDATVAGLERVRSGRTAGSLRRVLPPSHRLPSLLREPRRHR
jgi:hypothetical protein